MQGVLLEKRKKKKEKKRNSLGECNRLNKKRIKM